MKELFIPPASRDDAQKRGAIKEGDKYYAPDNLDRAARRALVKKYGTAAARSAAQRGFGSPSGHSSEDDEADLATMVSNHDNDLSHTPENITPNNIKSLLIKAANHEVVRRGLAGRGSEVIKEVADLPKDQRVYLYSSRDPSSPYAHSVLDDMLAAHNIQIARTDLERRVDGTVSPTYGLRYLDKAAFKPVQDNPLLEKAAMGLKAIRDKFGAGNKEALKIWEGESIDQSRLSKSAIKELEVPRLPTAAERKDKTPQMGVFVKGLVEENRNSIRRIESMSDEALQASLFLTLGSIERLEEKRQSAARSGYGLKTDMFNKLLNYKRGARIGAEVMEDRDRQTRKQSSEKTAIGQAEMVF